MNLLYTLIGTGVALLKRSSGTADGIQGRGGYTNGYGDVKGAAIKAVGVGWNIVIPSEISCQLPVDARGADGKAGDVIGVVFLDAFSCEDFGTTECVANDGDGDRTGVVTSDFGDGVNEQCPSTRERLKVGTAWVDNDNVVDTARCDSIALLGGGAVVSH